MDQDRQDASKDVRWSIREQITHSYDNASVTGADGIGQPSVPIKMNLTLRDGVSTGPLKLLRENSIKPVFGRCPILIHQRLISETELSLQ